MTDPGKIPLASLVTSFFDNSYWASLPNLCEAHRFSKEQTQNMYSEAALQTILSPMAGCWTLDSGEKEMGGDSHDDHNYQSYFPFLYLGVTEIPK